MVNECCGGRRKIRHQDQGIAWSKGKGRRVTNGKGASELRKSVALYNSHFGPEMTRPRAGNLYY